MTVIKDNNKHIIKKPELLAPAGDLEKLKYAYLYGADAVYIGGVDYSLRANANNFNYEQMKEAKKIAKEMNKKLYVTVNISLHNKELEGVIPYLKELDEIGIDAIIVSDPYIIKMAKEHTNLEIHLSTQQSTLNKEAFEFFKNQGVSRIVFGRETTKEDMLDIIKNVDIETEAFIHGAMCASYSGRCVMSNVMTARDANRGGCSQICRWDFNLLDKDNNDLTAEKNYTFSTKDLTMLKHIPELIDLGVTSFKIEGRMRSIYYVATIINIYRQVIDLYCSNKFNYEYNEEYEKILDNCANRDSVTQFFDGTNNETCSYYNNRIELSNQDFLGVILNYDKETSIALIEQRNYFKKGDNIEIFSPSGTFNSFIIEEIKGEDGTELDVVRHPLERVFIKIPFKVKKDDLIRIKK